MELIELFFSVITLLLLLLFYQNNYKNSERTKKQSLIFSITLLNGINILLTSIFDSLLGPIINYLAILLHILLFSFLIIPISILFKSNYPNSEKITVLASTGLFCIYLSKLFEFLNVSEFSIYALVIGTVVTLCSLILFSTSALMAPVLRNERSTTSMIALLVLPLFISFFLVLVFSGQQLMIQIVTTSLSQTLNLPIIREIPGLRLQVQSFFLMMSISSLLLSILGILSLFIHSNNKNAIFWILVILILGLEITLPFINVLRLIAISQLVEELKQSRVSIVHG